MNGRGGRRVGQDVDEVRIHHVVVEQVKDAHSVRPICSREAAAQAVSARSERIQSVSLSVPPPTNLPGFMGLKLMSMGSVVLVLTCTMAEVGNTRMCVQDVS